MLAIPFALPFGGIARNAAGAALALTISLLAAFSASAAETSKIKDIAVGSWSGGAYASDDGRLSHCRASRTVRQDAALMSLNISRAYAWSLAFGATRWNNKPGTMIPASYRIDAGQWTEVAATAVFEEAIEFPVDASVIEKLQRGHTLELVAAGLGLSFSLSGATQLVATLTSCVASTLQAEASRPPQSPPAAGGGQPGKAGPAAAGSSPKTSSFSGSGILISARGDVVTSDVSGCTGLTVARPGEPPVAARVVVTDAKKDLAVLRAPIAAADGDVARIRGGRAAPAGERIAVFGFPLVGALSSGGNIVAGNITAVAGVGDDIDHFQISAPIQPGNSGGPLLDFGGAVVGVVSTPLDTLQVLAVTGSAPQNINFAIKASVLTNFLDSHSIRYQTADTATDMDLVGVAAAAKKFTVLVTCTAPVAPAATPPAKAGGNSPGATAPPSPRLPDSSPSRGQAATPPVGDASSHL